MESTILKVDQDYRICLPQSLSKHAKWIAGREPVRACLLVGSPGRCRLMSESEAESDPGCQSLRARIDEEKANGNGSLIEFREEPIVALGLRLWPVELTPPGPGWRLTLPKVLAAVMQIRAKESSLAVLIFRQHVELWTMDTLRASMAIPFTDLI